MDDRQPSANSHDAHQEMYHSLEPRRLHEVFAAGKHSHALTPRLLGGSGRSPGSRQLASPGRANPSCLRE